MTVLLAGGWGYENLGDEAILAGYIESLSGRTELRISSANPTRTARAQRSGVRIERDATSRNVERLCVGGGGFLNGRWIPEIYRKLWNLGSMAGEHVVAHGVEVRRMDGRIREHLFCRTFSGASIGVRDRASAEELGRIKVETRKMEVVPDAISLLYPHLSAYGARVPEVSGKVVLNLLDVSNRSDADEAEVDVGQWDAFVVQLVDQLGDSAVGLVGGEGDRAYMNAVAPQLALIEPHTVDALIGTLRNAKAVLSVRMHPALLASALGTPVVAIPYCGKVRPTLRTIGVDDCIASVLNVDAVLEALRYERNHEEAWLGASATSESWLVRELGI